MNAFVISTVAVMIAAAFEMAVLLVVSGGLDPKEVTCR